jgi:hypothetical protein
VVTGLRKRWADILVIAVFFGFMAVVGVGGLLLPDRAKSTLEERALAKRPPVRIADIASGKFGRDLETYLSDQILLRDGWLFVHSTLNMRVLGKVEMNDVVVGAGSVLLGDLSGHKPLADDKVATELDATMSQFDELKQRVESYGGKLLVVGHPTKNSFLRADYPTGFGFPDDFVRIAPRYFDALDKAGIANVDMAPIFEQHRSDGLYLLTDHHWTFRGAYLTYVAMLEKLGMRPLAESELDIQTLPNPFVGSFNRKLAMAFPETQKITIATPKVPIPYTRTQDGKPSQSLFKNHAPGVGVSYRIYDQGDLAEIVVDTERPDLPSLLLVGDSFANPIETLIWTGFDESRYLDLRHYTQMSLYAYVEKYKPDVVITLVRDERYLYRLGNGLFSGSGSEADTE